MEEENSLLRMMIANNPPILLGSQSSQGSLPLSATLSGPPPLHVQLSQSERTWSTGAIRFILQQCKEHVEAHNTITMRSYQWARIHKLLVAQFPQESTRKVKSISDKCEKLQSQYYRVKKANNNTGAGATKFIWYDAIDEILSHTAKVNGVPGAMDQGESVRGTAAALVNFKDEGVGDGEPAWTRSPDRIVPAFTGIGNGETRSTASTSPRTRAANLVGCRGQGTSSSAKRARVDRDLMDTLNRMSESTATIEKM